MTDPERVERHRRRFVATCDAFERRGPGAVAASRAMLTEEAIRYARSLAPADLDALSYRQLAELASLLASARLSGPGLVA